MHVAGDVAGPLREVRLALGALYFFCSQTFGIMVEDLALNLYRKRWRGHGDKKDQDGPGNEWSTACETVVTRTMGFLWTITFLSCTTPLWVHPVAQAIRREDEVMQRSAFVPLVSWFQG